jgi:hypothetical protein
MSTVKDCHKFSGETMAKEEGGHYEKPNGLPAPG